MLDEVRTWYDVTRAALATLYRDVRREPESLPFQLTSLALFAVRDAALRHNVRAQRELADLAILSYFATFEQLLLDHFESSTSALVKGETEPLKRRILEGQSQLRKSRETPITIVLDYYKAVVDSDLVGQVKQVYKYRNWVAHGKRGPAPINVTPSDAYSRLQCFLEHLP
jgi:hypothetical protein